uniref:Uncharacterized protein n=1 Tax=Panagrolaimus sp. JU765 TaxID=591449 RepID=A0AC34PZP9_9BILA
MGRLNKKALHLKKMRELSKKQRIQKIQEKKVKKRAPDALRRRGRPSREVSIPKLPNERTVPQTVEEKLKAACLKFGRETQRKNRKRKEEIRQERAEHWRNYYAPNESENVAEKRRPTSLKPAEKSSKKNLQS